MAARRPALRPDGQYFNTGAAAGPAHERIHEEAAARQGAQPSLKTETCR